MSQLTLTKLMRAALMTRAEAISRRISDDNAWEMGFATAIQEHMNDEACRWLAQKGCYHVMPDGTLCHGVLSDVESVCDRCVSQRAVNLVDAEEAAQVAIGKGTE